MASAVTFRPLTIDRWDDLVDLFGPERGACAGCWCMWPRIRGVDFKALTKEQRRKAFRKIVEKGPPPGLLAYEGKVAIGWVAISPRAAVHRFNISRVSAPVDSEACDLDRTWALTCFYVRNSHRRQGLTQKARRGRTELRQETESAVRRGLRHRAGQDTLLGRGIRRRGERAAPTRPGRGRPAFAENARCCVSICASYSAALISRGGARREIRYTAAGGTFTSARPMRVALRPRRSSSGRGTGQRGP